MNKDVLTVIALLKEKASLELIKRKTKDNITSLNTVNKALDYYLFKDIKKKDTIQK